MTSIKAARTYSKPAVLINAASGSTDDVTEELQSYLSGHFDQTGPIVYIDPGKLEGALDAALKDNVDLVIVYGGDGTALSVAKTCTKRGVPILPLPGGTMNMLHKSLYGTDVWQDVLERGLACTRDRWLPVGVAGHDIFLVGAFVGTPSRLSRVREAMRDLDVIEAAKELVSTLSDTGVDDVFTYSTDTHPEHREANLLQIYAPRMSDYAPDAGALDVSAIDIDALGDVAWLGQAFLSDVWRDDQTVDSTQAKNIYIHGSGHIDLLLDGEEKPQTLPLNISLREHGVRVLAPQVQPK